MFYNNLKAVCDAKNIKITPLVAECGGAKGSISNWKKGASPNSDIVINLAVRLNVSTDLLLLGTENNSSPILTEDEQELLQLYSELSEKDRTRVMERAKTLHELENEDRKISITASNSRRRYIDIADIAAGAGISEPFTKDDSFTKRSFKESDIPDNASCGIPLNGDSMEPEYPNGCIVWVDKTAPIKYGDTVIAIVNGEPFCKIYRQDGLYSYNNAYKPIKVSGDNRVDLFGKVIGCYIEN